MEPAPIRGRRRLRPPLSQLPVPRSRKRRSSAFSWRLAACCLDLWAGCPAAAEYSVDGDFALGQIYNSNITLSAPAKGVFGTSLDAHASLAAREQDWEAGGKARVNRQFFYPASGIDMTNVYADGYGAYRTERSRFSLAGNYTDAWSLASQTQAAVTGLVLTRLHRNQQSIGPAWTYALDETTSGTLQYGYSHADYEFVGGGRSLQDSHSVSSELVRQLNEHWSANLDISYAHYGTNRDNPAYSTQTDYVSAMVGARYAFDASLSLAASAGAQYSRMSTESTQNVLKGYLLVSLDPPAYVPVVESVTVRNETPTPVAPLFSVTARKRFETAELELDYSRQISPSFNGLLLEVDRVVLRGRQRFAENLDGSLAAYYYTQTYSGNGTLGAYSGYTSYSLDGSLAWRLSPHWSATASYKFVYRETGAAIPTAESHAVFLNFRYDFDSHSF
jgi:hypothetical protein